MLLRRALPAANFRRQEEIICGVARLLVKLLPQINMGLRINGEIPNFRVKHEFAHK